MARLYRRGSGLQSTIRPRLSTREQAANRSQVAWEAVEHPVEMVRLRRALLVAAVLALTATASPAMAKIDVLQTALRALRVAERAD
jgi:hypothetical protein